MDQRQRIARLAEELRVELERLHAAMTALNAELEAVQAREAANAGTPVDVARFHHAVTADMRRLSSSVSRGFATFRAEMDERLEGVEKGAERR